MVLELVAGRLISRYLGSSLYTWTSVIGVVLAGISLGNYLGGRIADRFNAAKALAVLFSICSAACVLVVALNNIVGGWVWLWQFGWSVRIFSHVCIVFLLPSTLLGAISPVVAKMALEQGLPPGRTIGNIYAWSAAGSIAGTFLAGFYLIAAMGTIAIIWTIGAMLLILAILYWIRCWAIYVWAAVFFVLLTIGNADADWARNAGTSFALREPHNPDILYEDESQYCYIAVVRISSDPDRRKFIQDKLRHSEITMNNIRDLKYFYERIYATVTHRQSREKDRLSILAIGGGGYVFPRYIADVWPGSRVDVAEIDPAVTEAAIQAFGLKADAPINIFTMDARNYVDQLIQKKMLGGAVPLYDFVYEDAFDNYSVPYQLVTREFNDKIAQILTDDGIYMVNVVDVLESGRFIGSIVDTLKLTFPDVWVFAENLPPGVRNTFVVIAAKKNIDLEHLAEEEMIKSSNLWIMSNSDVEMLGKKAGGTVLTDDYAPVENLVKPAVIEWADNSLASEYIKQADKLRENKRWDKSIAKYKRAAAVIPDISTSMYFEIGLTLAEQGKLEQAIKAFQTAIEYNDKAPAGIKQSVSIIYYNIALVLKKLNRHDEALSYIDKAIEGLHEDLDRKPNSIEVVYGMGIVLMEKGNFTEATGYFEQAVDMNPYDMQNYTALVQALVAQDRYDQAVAVLKKAVGFMLYTGEKESADQLQKILEWVELRKSEIEK